MYYCSDTVLQSIRYGKSAPYLAAIRRFAPLESVRIGSHPVRILISGSGGLIGSALVPVLTGAGHDVVRLVRRFGPSSGTSDAIGWDPERREIARDALEGVDSVVHLAGEPILGRWTGAKKQRIAESRTIGTSLVAEALATLRRRPTVLVCASGAGYYGDRGDELLTEDSKRGVGFLADLCRDWEAAADPARRAGIRVVHLRTGLVLSRIGGLLKSMLLPFRLGLGGPIGRGRQYWSWIALEDLVTAYVFALEHEDLFGGVNATAPNPVTNAEFTRTLGGVLNRPAVLPVPPFALRLLFGREATDEAMLSGARVIPARLVECGYRFRYPELEPALRQALGPQEVPAQESSE